ncbi:MAG: hypothetical protein PHR28_02695 [candidate division Zixibacteria bacterium]|nr:hypothetical protein [candidate division Zixibacteria bacterium]
MEISDQLQFTFDEENRILYLTQTGPVRITTDRQLIALMEAIRAQMEQHQEPGRMYMIADMTQLVVVPELSHLYGALAEEIYSIFVYPNGIARYGHQITHITIRRGYMDYRDKNPNLFGTRVEAENYIRSLIARRRAESPERSIEAMPETSSVD